jgi:hypothetical protein
LAEDPKWELAILATVQGFYEKLLQEFVEGEVPVPAGLETVSLHGENDVGETLGSMRRWLRLLDMAITPAMLRRAFNDEVDPEIAEAKTTPILIATKPTSLPPFFIVILACRASGNSAAMVLTVRSRSRHLKLRCWKFWPTPICRRCRRSTCKLCAASIH